ncbi:hypothetical protein CHLNCDRAFT_139316 [Chlorella variabilis]|uniref:Phosphatidylinositol-specific phospholipase C X domain-containing protein n=1 Tax=Chlorella variabilis TaxID=554065 RepID=E1ZQ00_CHLVA|nr:hypothetical protein CHLNCDRAFT_139316 [Chlorella variabilis]EFN52069.1 hypothetical protein CHLNCDRAFT_139316 [Chlorella variabilis]|eukprot:XP_005844171.1 hypothetical protein CHLNCDRAFT_139316 [Chlorella variabilis]
MLPTGLLPTLLLVLGASVVASAVPEQQQQREQRLFAAAPSPHSCGEVPVDGLELSPAEQELLQYICWPQEGAALAEALLEGAAAPRGVPAGVNCTVVQWCDADVCTDVCARGSVVVEPWLAHAIKQQTKLVQTLPLCYQFLLGTHNSAISLADGYGNLDDYFRGFFKYIKWALPGFADAPLHTNNQLLSLTDQLRLGVRALELDTHWVGGVMRIAHCGGLHVPQLNKLIEALNFVARLLHRSIRWDTETLGCMPSLSSIPSMEQRLLTDAMQEVKDWMEESSNADEFLVLYFDDQPNLKTWGVVGNLLDDILSVFPRDWIFSTEDKMLEAGKRLMLVSGTDYGDTMEPLIFGRGKALCGWNEPPLASVDGTPECLINQQGMIEPQPLFDGMLTRVISCELQYGPMNCDFAYRGTNDPVFDEATLPPVTGCGLNMPSPDLLTPDRAAATIWTWAPGHPFDPTSELGLGDSQSTSAGRNASLNATDGGWVLDASLPRGSCPTGAEFDLPRHPRENYLLAAALQRAGHEAAWLPVHGPEWDTAGLPAKQQQPQPTNKRRILMHVGLPTACGLSFIVLASMVAGRRMPQRRPCTEYQALGQP